MTEKDEKVGVKTTIPESTYRWLCENYPDATSDSQLLVLAISDARSFRRQQGVEVCVDNSEDD